MFGELIPRGFSAETNLIEIHLVEVMTSTAVATDAGCGNYDIIISFDEILVCSRSDILLINIPDLDTNTFIYIQVRTPTPCS